MRRLVALRPALLPVFLTVITVAVVGFYLPAPRVSGGSSGVIIFGHSRNMAVDRLVSFNSQSPQTFITNIPLTGLAANEDILGIDFRASNGQLYGVVSGPNSSRLVTINTTTGAVTTIGPGITPPLPVNTFYGVEFNDLTDELRVVNFERLSIRINPNTGTRIATDPNLAYRQGDPNFGNLPVIDGIAFVGGAQNIPGLPEGIVIEMIGLDVSNGQIVGIAFPSGELVTIGPAGFVPFSSADMDSVLIGAGLITFAVYNDLLQTINRTTGAATTVGMVDPSVPIVGMAVQRSPAPTPTPTPTATPSPVPVAMITLRKTVGTDSTPMLCPDTSVITVPAGTTVYYCYTVTNTGNVPFRFHDLFDDKLGQLLTELDDDLPPGESITLTGPSVLFAVINANTTNVATWTARNPGVATAQAQASATVIVGTPTPTPTPSPMPSSTPTPTPTRTPTPTPSATPTPTPTATPFESPPPTFPPPPTPTPTPTPDPVCNEFVPEVEINNTPASAQVLTRRQGTLVVFGAVSSPGDVDYYRVDGIDPGSRAWLYVDTGGSPATGDRDSSVDLFAADGASLIETDADDGTGNGSDGTTESLNASSIAGRTLTAGGSYFIRVRGSGDPGTNIVSPYRLFIVIVREPVNQEIELNDSVPTANGLIVGTQSFLYSASISTPADVDFYSMELFAGDTVFVSVDSDPERTGMNTLDGIVQLFAPGGNAALMMPAVNSGPGGAGNSEAFAYLISESGTYFIRVSGNGTESARPYRIKAATCNTFQAIAQPTPTPTPTPDPTPTPPGTTGSEADIAPRPHGGDGLRATDSAQFKRFIAGLDTFSMAGNEYQRADVAPEDTFGDGRLTAADQQQIDNYIAVLDPVRPGGGPTGPIPGAFLERASVDNELVDARGRAYRIVSAGRGQQGAEIIVTIELDARGNETGMSFTLQYDPSKLSFLSMSGTDNNPDVFNASGSPDGMYKTMNATQERYGRLGLLLSSGSTVDQGKRQILNLRFHIFADAATGSTSIRFVDDVIAKSTTNADAQSLAASYEDGEITIIRSGNSEKKFWMSQTFRAWPGFRRSAF